MDQILGNMDMNPKVYKREDVSVHNTHEDCWLVIEGNVFMLRNGFRC